MKHFYSKDFLFNLDRTNHKEIFAKVISLDFNENPIQLISGRVTGGSINVDGASAIRRTCSVTIVANNFNYDNYLWGLNTKFKLEIGVKNNIDPNFEDIIWFPQGVYVLTSFNVSRSATNFTINLSGKDKMCLLNGDIGGSLNSDIDFGTIEEIDNEQNLIIRKLNLKEIIRNIVHVYGQEPYHNIIINDLDILGKELLEYRYDIPLYLYRKDTEPKGEYRNVLMEDDDSKGYFIYNNKGEYVELESFNKLTYTHLEALITSLDNEESDVQPVYYENKPYYFTKIEPGQTAGYRITDLTYAGDLIAKAGESITSVLDKIKNMLVEYEYFYNLEGQFIFQKKQSFISTIWPLGSNGKENEKPEYTKMAQTLDYTFFKTELITALNNNPNLANVKNDYTIRGEKETVAGAKIPIHLRYAIDEKPSKYVSIQVEEDNAEVAEYNQKYNVDLKCQPLSTIYKASDTYSYSASKRTMNCDWREVLYRMSEDYYKYNHLTDFESRVAKANPDLFPFGLTGYEQYYIDIYNFWRELYYPELKTDFNNQENNYNLLKTDTENLRKWIYGTYNDDAEIMEGGMENDIILLQRYLADDSNKNLTLANKQVKEWNKDGKYDIYADEKKTTRVEDPSLYLVMLQALYYTKVSELNLLDIKLSEEENKKNKLQEYVKTNFYTKGDYINWNKNVFEAPYLLNFWFDFLDNSSDLSKYSVRNIGNRPKVVQDTNIKAIYFKETPEILFKRPDEAVDNITNLRMIQVPFIEQMFTISAQGKSAKEKLDELIYQHNGMTETATITTIPIYYLQPNQRIKLVDEETSLNGDFTINKITIPLTYNGTMTLSVTKVIESII